MRAAGGYTAIGDVVNTASRLQAAARPGQVIVGPVTYDATRARRALRAARCAGREGPRRARRSVDRRGGHRASGATTQADPRRARRARPEMSLLRRMFDAALNRQRAQLVLLFGEAGVGKSRLAVELAAMAYEGERDGAQGPLPPVRRGQRVVADRRSHPEHVRGRPRRLHERRARKVEATVARVTSRDPNDSHVERISDGLLYLLGRFGERADVDPAARVARRCGRCRRTSRRSRERPWCSSSPTCIGAMRSCSSSWTAFLPRSAPFLSCCSPLLVPISKSVGHRRPDATTSPCSTSTRSTPTPPPLVEVHLKARPRARRRAPGPQRRQSPVHRGARGSHPRLRRRHRRRRRAGVRFGRPAGHAARPRGGAARHAARPLMRGARGLRGRRLEWPRRSRRGAGRRPVALGDARCRPSPTATSWCSRTASSRSSRS